MDSATSKGLTKEQTLMLSWALTLHNVLLYAHSLCLIDQKQIVGYENQTLHFPGYFLELFVIYLW